MNSKNLNSHIWSMLFLIVLLAKFLFLLFGGSVQSFGLGGGNDADYYAESAIQQGENAVNSWPILLSLLHSAGLYSRTGVVYLLLLLSSVVIPFVLIWIVRLKNTGGRKNKLWFVLFAINAYPALFFFSLDIYRDIFMLLVFLLACFPIKKLSERKRLLKKLPWLFLGIIGTIILYGLREYLGAAYGVALCYAFCSSYNITKLAKKIKPTYLIIIYISTAFSLYLSGVLTELIDYRAGFNPLSGGSTFGLRFDSPALFVFNFLLSWAFQIFGLWPFTGFAILLFLVESLPFVFALSYTIRNRRFINNFGWSLLVFFISYNTIWIIGNDNLGTAWRLRIFSYITILMLFLMIYQEKLRLRSATFNPLQEASN